MSIDLSLSRIHSALKLLPEPYTRPTIHIAGTNGKGSVSALIYSILRHSSSPSTKQHLSVGRFNSPHLIHPRDSILIDDIPLSLDEYNTNLAFIRSLASSISLTPFEELTLVALHTFQSSHVDIAVIEVGLGGRLDATNAIPTSCILVSALTSIALDHASFLGDTIAKIAREKSGIVRRGRGVVLGRQAAENEVREVVEEKVKEIGASILEIIEVRGVEAERKADVDLNPRTWDVVEVTTSNPSPVTGDPQSIPTPDPVEFTIPSLSSQPIRTELPLNGNHQLDNLAIALGVVQALLDLSGPQAPQDIVPIPNFRECISVESIKDGVRNVHWNGRLSWHRLSVPVGSEKPADEVRDDEASSPSLKESDSVQPKKVTFPILVDGAHNPASGQSLNAYIESFLASNNTPNRVHITYILALSHSPGKDPKDTLEPLLGIVRRGGSTGVEVASTGVAVVPFGAPEGMPWVKGVGIGAVVKALEEVGLSVGRILGDGAEILKSGGSEGEKKSDAGESVKEGGEEENRNQEGENVTSEGVVQGGLPEFEDAVRDNKTVEDKDKDELPRLNATLEPELPTLPPPLEPNQAPHVPVPEEATKSAAEDHQPSVSPTQREDPRPELSPASGSQRLVPEYMRDEVNKALENAIRARVDEVVVPRMEEEVGKKVRAEVDEKVRAEVTRFLEAYWREHRGEDESGTTRVEEKERKRTEEVTRVVGDEVSRMLEGEVKRKVAEEMRKKVGEEMKRGDVLKRVGDVMDNAQPFVPGSDSLPTNLAGGAGNKNSKAPLRALETTTSDLNQKMSVAEGAKGKMLAQAMGKTLLREYKERKEAEARKKLYDDLDASPSQTVDQRPPSTPGLVVPLHAEPKTRGRKPRLVDLLVPRSSEGEAVLADVDERGLNAGLWDALRWAAGRVDGGVEEEEVHLVVLAGSLYLVSDFYRVLEWERQRTV